MELKRGIKSTQRFAMFSRAKQLDMFNNGMLILWNHNIWHAISEQIPIRTRICVYYEGSVNFRELCVKSF